MQPLAAATFLTDLATLEGETAERATAALWLRVETGSGIIELPERAWSDFPFLLLPVWLAEMERVLRGRGRCAQLRFMDGPEAIVVERGVGRDAGLACVRDRAGGGWWVGADHLRASLHAVARDLVAAAAKRGWQDAAVATLRGQLAAYPAAGLLRVEADKGRNWES